MEDVQTKQAIAKRDFLGFSSLDANKIIELFDYSLFIKKKRKEHLSATAFLPLRDKTVAMIFSKPSLRTRVSFEIGIHELGGYAINLDGQSIGLGSRESVEDIARLLSRYNDAIVARLHDHAVIEGLAEHASIPVINALTDLSHPCQVLADAFTLYEKSLWNEGIKVVFVGDGNNVANSWIELASLLPFHFVLACPEGYTPNQELLNAAREKGISKIEIMHDPKEAAANADVLYTDVWTSMGQEEESRRGGRGRRTRRTVAARVDHAVFISSKRGRGAEPGEEPGKEKTQAHALALPTSSVTLMPKLSSTTTTSP